MDDNVSIVVETRWIERCLLLIGNWRQNDYLLRK